MDYFERIIATLLESEGFWVRQSFKVNLTKEEKRLVGRPSMPRPEIDLLALNFKKNEVIAFEAKSFLDSYGVKVADIQQENETPAGRYKLFTSKKYREIVIARLLKDLIKISMANASTKIKLGLAAGKVFHGEDDNIRLFMEKNNWVFWSPKDIKDKVEALAKHGYENDPAIITAKILMR